MTLQAKSPLFRTTDWPVADNTERLAALREIVEQLAPLGEAAMTGSTALSKLGQLI